MPSIATDIQEMYLENDRPTTTRLVTSNAYGLVEAPFIKLLNVSSTVRLEKPSSTRGGAATSIKTCGHSSHASTYAFLLSV